ncbi:MAG: 30S ribosomal protein S20 [Candidatus Saccharibacteria bacterium]|nr:30S ribosomal protein S20 [Candidatus Saccharibacteria bacterium]MCY4010885.1 30S ribosomal protein S20 [Candidatus Saccharibacteria bacterium]MCY4089014.1 30S ribosomal protein S20 [Candidatus Saccharibacteria bacterium]
MPIIKSSKKRVRQASVRTARNMKLKKDIRLATKNLDESLKLGKKTEINNAHTKLVSLLDKASKKKLWHKNKVARRKSRIIKKIKESQAKSTSTSVKQKS